MEELQDDPTVRVINGRRRTLMSGLGDAHTHFTWNNGALDKLGDVGVEEHTLMTARSAQCYLDSGYTMCFGAASAKDRLDCVIRDYINAGDIPGPRYLANGKEMAVRNGELAAGITVFADGPLEMREVIRHHKDIGVDQIKLSMSGEEVIITQGFVFSLTLIYLLRSLNHAQPKTHTTATLKPPPASMKRIALASDSAPMPALVTRSSNA